MIEVSNDVKAGDRVFAWFSFVKPKDSKKPDEVEYRLGESKQGWLKLEAPEGGYHLVFTKELLETWYGRIRKAK
jgi:hypothetical protein